MAARVHSATAQANGHDIHHHRSFPRRGRLLFVIPGYGILALSKYSEPIDEATCWQSASAAILAHVDLFQP